MSGLGPPGELIIIAMAYEDGPLKVALWDWEGKKMIETEYTQHNAASRVSILLQTSLTHNRVAPSRQELVILSYWYVLCQLNFCYIILLYSFVLDLGCLLLKLTL